MKKGFGEKSFKNQQESTKRAVCQPVAAIQTAIKTPSETIITK